MDKNENYIQRWIIYIKSIKDDTERMLINRYFLKEYFQIVQNNQKIQNPRDFHDWIMGNYYCSIVINIRRQLDIRKDSFSFLKLLKEIEGNSEVLSRRWYKDKFKYDWADADFTNNAGSGEFMDKKLVGGDIKKLTDLGYRIEKFGDEHLAHRSKNPTITKLKINEVDIFIDEFETLFKRYYLIFTAEGYTSFLPTWQYDWQNIFNYRWLLKSKL